MNQKRRAKIQIDLAALKHNAVIAKKMANGARIMSAIKANAYGHGILEAANALKGVVDEFAVASIDDVINIRENSSAKNIPITVLSGFYSADEIPIAIEKNVSLTVYDTHQIDILLNYDFSKSHEQINIWLKVDTGMSRLGLAPTELDEYIIILERNEHVCIRGIMSHFANADKPEHELNHHQLDTFQQLRQRYEQKDWQWSLANSAALLAMSDAAYNWVRPGIMLYGSSPFANRNVAEFDLHPVMTFSSEVISIKKIKKDQAIGYGSTWTAEKDTQVAVVACGYGDGYPRGIKSNTPVLVAGQKTRILGRVSMDLIVIEVTDITVQIGSKVVFWGDGLSIDEVALAANTISYELLCNITARVEREYINTKS